MILYHGTNTDIETIDLDKGQLGPIADDGVVLLLTNYREGIYSPEQAAKLLQDKYLDQQYFFGTERALQYLTKTYAETV